MPVRGHRKRCCGLKVAQHNMPWHPLMRTVRLEGAASDFIDSCVSANPRFEDHWQGLEWILARTPDKPGLARVASDPMRYRLLVSKGISQIGLRDIFVLYSFNEDEVTVHDVGLRHE